VKIYGDCLKTCEDFSTNFGDNRTGYCITKTLCFSPGNFFTKNKITVAPYAHYSHELAPCELSVSLLETAIFAQTEVMEEESGAVLSILTLTEHDFQEAFEK
jgi:hypothetical protein